MATEPPAAWQQRDAVVAVVGRAGRVLVVRRGPGAVFPGYWAPLSGRVEPGEAQPAAVVREVKEEVGLVVRPLAKVWECDTHDHAFRLHWWQAVPLSSVAELSADPGEVSETRWVLPAEFRLLTPTFAGDHEFFDRVLPGLAWPD